MHSKRLPVVVPATMLALCLGVGWLAVRGFQSVSVVSVADASQIWGGDCDTKYIQPDLDQPTCSQTVNPNCEAPGTCQHCGGTCPQQHIWVLGGQTPYQNVDLFQQAWCPNYVPWAKKCYNLSCICDTGAPWTGYQCGFFGPTYAYCP
jgi:hypothetical protein